MRKLMPVFVLLVAATSGGATDCGQIIDDPGFDVWCGDSLCRWAVEKGEVARAATWHEADRGVELVGPEVSIAQLTEVASSDGRCVAFDLVADVADDAEVHLQLDVFGDGSIELDERLPTSDWRALSFRVRMPDFYQGVRFRLTKRGGHAVLANIGASIAPDAECVGVALVVGTRPNGVTCTEDPQCTSGTCASGFFHDVCGECKTDADCSGGTICGQSPIADAHVDLYPACVVPGSAETNAGCGQDAQCATGLCEGGGCAVCDDAADCGGAACASIEYSVPHGDGRAPSIVKGASHCAAGSAAVASGGACVDDVDCASSACVGAPLRMCSTFWLPRRCDDDLDCPGYGFGAEAACVTVGTRGGVCQ